MTENDEELYDEFGNYIGPELNDDDDSDDDDDDDEEEEEDDVMQTTNRVLDHGNDDDASDVSEDHTMNQNHVSVLIDDDENNTNTQLSFLQQQQHQQQIVLHEDKDHYMSAEQVYGEDVKAIVLDEDAMDLDTPIVEPIVTKQHTTFASSSSSSTAAKDEKLATKWNYTDDYLNIHLQNETTRTRRGIGFFGHLHHGKTTLIDMIIEPTLVGRGGDDRRVATPKRNAKISSSSAIDTGGYWGPRASLDVNNGGGPRYMDLLKCEQERQMSLVATPITCLLPDTRGKSYCITILDCPGHVQFHDESVASMKLVDGAVIIIDCVEGVQMHTEMCIKQAIVEGIPIMVILNKMDRLINELKLPPNDAYFKMLHIIDSVNDIIHLSSRGRYPPVLPSRGNVAFASAQHGYMFTVQSFASQIIADHTDIGNSISVLQLSQRLWGDCYYDPTSRTFQKSARECRSIDAKSTTIKRTFVTFILEPIYKIYAACLGEREGVTNQILRNIGVLLTKEQLRASARPLLRTAMSKFLQAASSGFVDMLVQHVPHPSAAAHGKISRCYSGPIDSDSKIVRCMQSCDPNGPLVIHCVKNFASADGQTFWTFGRIYSGTIRPAESVKILGEGYSPEDDEDVATAIVSCIAIPRGRTYTYVNSAKAGNWVLLEGVDVNIAKTATIISATLSDDDSMNEMCIFHPLKFPQAGDEAIMKLSIEPLNPSELPKMVEGLRRVSKAYPMSSTKVEESGEHVILGTGELYMDCLMHDLRHVYSDIEVKVADPIVAFKETVIDTSSIKCFSETANKRNKLTFIAEPMDDGLAEQLEAGLIDLKWDKKKVGRFFQTKYNWDLLSSRSVWAFGDSPSHGTNILMDDTLPSEVDKTLLNSCRSSIVQGFQWATREGPLCEEPVRGTKIKILDVTLADKAIYRGGGQLIPTARRTVHSALLTSTPRLMEPVFRLDIQCPTAIVDSIQPILTRRRGHIVQDRPIPATTLCCVKGFIPVLDSFGFETDLRTYTQGQAMVYSVFDHWAIVPGDPMDRTIILHPLEPSPHQHLARELLVKTRRRKGLSEDVSVSKFFDEGMKKYLEGIDSSG
jgi:116 kDa U5 small nuclear ribonucleoprotein component